MVIKKGTHAPFRFPELLFDQQRLAAKVVFTRTCAYDIGIKDQADINKLFGIGYFPSHHKNSVRFGWRYVIELDAIEVMAYWYSKGERKSNHICFVSLEKEHLYILNIMEVGHILDVYDNAKKIGNFVIGDVPGRSIGYLLRPYFGGNQTAPHDIEIKIDWM